MHAHRRVVRNGTLIPDRVAGIFPEPLPPENYKGLPCIARLGNARQEIDLWTGVVYSRFELNRKEVKVRTVCHPDKDMIGVSIESELLNDGNMSIYLDFPYPDGRYFKHYIGRYDTISGHTSTFEKLAPNSVRIARTMDDTHYYATLDWTG